MSHLPNLTMATEQSPLLRSRLLRILVVDDSPDVADSLGLLLTMMGHEVRTASDGVEGIQTADVFRPDLVLLDLGMPRMNGYDTARAIRQQPWGKGVVLIALTGWSQDDRHCIQEAGFDHYLVKPVEPDTLKQLLSAQSARSTAG
jgi:CheY-like chemotaxis protein